MENTNKERTFLLFTRRVQDPPIKGTSTNSSKKTILVEQGPNDTNRHGSERKVGEVAYCPGFSPERELLSSIFLVGKGWRESTGNHSQKP